MSKSRRQFQRTTSFRHYKRKFIVATEGEVTEPQYFGLFNGQNVTVNIKCLRSHGGSAPEHVLKRMKKYLKGEGLKNSDRAWIVIDKDHWTDTQIAQIHQWSETSSNFGLALSNPKFEYWLLLHFENGVSVGSSNDCSSRLKNYIPNYNKEIDPQKFTNDSIQRAISRAKLRDNPPCADWPHNIGCTTVYRLVEDILQA